MRRHLHALVAALVVVSVLPAGAVAATGTTADPAATGAEGVNVQRTHPSTDLGTFEAVVNASDETLDRSDVAVPGDVLVVRLDGAGIGAAIANASGANATARFGSWLAREDTSLSFAPVNGSGPVLVTDGPGLAVRAGTFDGERRTYLLVETGAANYAADGGGTGATDLVGREYRFRASDRNATLTSDPIRFERPAVTLVDPEAENGSVTLERPTGDVFGESSLPMGTPLTVSLVGENGTAASATVRAEPTGTMVPDRFTQFGAELDTATAPADGRLVVRFPNGSYPYPSTVAEWEATVEGEPVDGDLTLTTARARGGLFDGLTNATELRAARELGDVVRSRLPTEAEASSSVVRGDLLVVRIESERLAATLRDRFGDTPTERFRDYLHDTDAALVVAQTADTVTPQRQRKSVLVNETRLRVVADGNTRWVLLDTGNLSVGYGGDADSQTVTRPGEAYGVSFRFAGESARDEPMDRVAVAEAAVQFDPRSGSDRFFVEPALANLPVESTLAPGHEVTVVLERDGDLRRQTIELAGRNVTRGTATFDLSHDAEGETYGVSLYVGRPGEAELRVDEAAVERTSLTVDEPTALVQVADRSPTTVTVTGELSRGGTLALELVGTDERVDIANVDPGQFEAVLTLPAADYDGPVEVRVVAYRSTEGTERGEVVYTEPDGDPVEVRLNLRPDATPERTHTPETPPPTTDDVPDPGTTVPASERTSDDGPGFGPVTAVLALLAVALLTRER